ncbi:uncharacterized protein LOC135122139 [Zophobas morio]|uniref:uncharacterized protein LOC135122139 n=1 Tax=Zophobas morio TaxID=2755281 RepID=UPI003083EB10
MQYNTLSAYAFSALAGSVFCLFLSFAKDDEYSISFSIFASYFNIYCTKYNYLLFNCSYNVKNVIEFKSLPEAVRIHDNIACQQDGKRCVYLASIAPAVLFSSFIILCTARRKPLLLILSGCLGVTATVMFMWNACSVTRLMSLRNYFLNYYFIIPYCFSAVATALSVTYDGSLSPNLLARRLFISTAKCSPTRKFRNLVTHVEGSYSCNPSTIQINAQAVDAYEVIGGDAQQIQASFVMQQEFASSTKVYVRSPPELIANMSPGTSPEENKGLPYFRRGDDAHDIP